MGEPGRLWQHGDHQAGDTLDIAQSLRIAAPSALQTFRKERFWGFGVARPGSPFSYSLRQLRRFVFCRQRSDERLKRGGEQKSVAVLSAQPYTSVLTPLSQHAGPLYFNRGPSALQTVHINPLPASPHLIACSHIRHLAVVHECAGVAWQGRSTKTLCHCQVFMEVQQWDPPSAGLRAMVLVGAMTLPAQVPAPATLPMPPPDQAHPGPAAGPDGPAHPLAPLPTVRQPNGAETIQGAFFEVRPPLLELLQA